MARSIRCVCGVTLHEEENYMWVVRFLGAHCYAHEHIPIDSSDYYSI